MTVSLPLLPSRLSPTFWDAWVGWLERRRRFPSARAWEEALAYYDGLYADRGPDPAQFRRLVIRCGLPAWANPHPQGLEEHYRFHPTALALVDVEAILVDLERSWARERQAVGQSGVEASMQEESAWVGTFPSIEGAVRARGQEQEATRALWAIEASRCWGWAVLEAGNIVELQRWVHPDNLAWATVHAARLASKHGAPWSPQAMLLSAQKQGLLSDQATQAWLGRIALASGTSEESTGEA